MSKKYFTIFLFIVGCNYCLAQQHDENTDKTDTPKSAPLLTDIGATAALLQKIPLPTEQKATPAVFYLLNDKPVSAEEYRRSLQQAAPKK